MKTISLLICCMVFMSGCSTPPDRDAITIARSNGIGGTGKPAEGIGGTGHTPGSGIGGTGQVADNGLGGTGIVGTITGFGSIWVNGVRITYEEEQAVTVNQRPASLAELQIGQVVAVSSDKLEHNYHARTIDIVHEVVGPVSAVDPEDKQLQILSQTVEISDKTLIVDQRSGESIAFDELSPEQAIKVSGLRNAAGEIVASRLDIIEPAETVQLIGQIEQTDGGEWLLNQQAVAIDDSLLLEDLERVLVSGHLEGDVLVADSIGPDSIDTLMSQVTELVYEGYLYNMDELEQINIGGWEFTLPETIDFSAEDWDDSPVQLNAILSEDGDFNALDFIVEDEGGDLIDLIPEEMDFEELYPDELLLEEDYDYYGDDSSWEYEDWEESPEFDGEDFYYDNEYYYYEDDYEYCCEEATEP